MPDATTAAFAELQSNLDYARDLVRGGQHLEHLKVGAFDVADLYRAAWVQAVSALDHWVHRELYERALGFALNVTVSRPEKFLTLKVPMHMFEDVHHHSKTLREAFSTHLRTLFGYESFQSPEKIRHALSYVSEATLWPSVATQLTRRGGTAISQGEVVSHLRSIVQRRNRIAHEADRDPEDRSRRQPISDHEANQTIDRIEQIATAVAAVLGPPPPDERDQPGRASSSEHSIVNIANSNKAKLYREFWLRFKPVVEQRAWTTSSAPSENGWNMPSGVTGATWALSFARFGCRAELYFEHPDPQVNTTRWRTLYARRDEIRAHFGDDVLFDDLPNNKGCRIEVRLNGPTINDRERWPDILKWMEDSQARLRSAQLLVLPRRERSRQEVLS